MAAKPQRPIPAATFGRNFGLYREQAIAEGVVEVTNNGRPIYRRKNMISFEILNADKAQHQAAPSNFEELDFCMWLNELE